MPFNKENYILIKNLSA